MQRIYRFSIGIAMLFVANATYAQIAPGRTWPELKDAVLDRVKRQAYPLTGYKADEVGAILDSVQSLDRDEWARAWSRTGERYWNDAKAKEASDRAHAREAYLAAWRYFGFGAWPTQNSPEKKRAHERATQAFQAYARLADPPIEVVRVPFEGKEIIGYLQFPRGVRKPAPVVMSLGGLDSYKEYVVEQYGPDYLAAGLAYLALDMPGTGDAPIKIDVGAERMYSRVIDHLIARGDIDPKRIGFQGVSWGGHWASRVAYVEQARLRAVVNWAGPTHGYFQREWQLKALGTREYLFDLFPARAGVYGANTLEEFLAYGPRMSLKDGGFVGKPAAPMLLVNGERDSQVPIDDLYMELRTGTPKEAWVNPQGGHIGRGAGWPDGRIFKEVIVPWFARMLRP
jgi:esterase FrsA